MNRFDRIVVSGASGAIGGVVVRHLMQKYPLAEIVCVLRNQRSFERLSALLSDAQRRRVKPVFADLAADEPPNVTVPYPQPRRCLAVHCAADVSWTKSERLMGPINVRGTQRFAELAASLGSDRPAFVFLSTAFLDGDGSFRNAYEKTKRDAEILLRERFGDRLDIAVVRCSLVVGSSVDGSIPRFNGIYPLVRLVALAEVPCVIADANYRVDTVPVDYVAEEVVHCAEYLGGDRKFIGIAAASGHDQSLSIADLVARIQTNTNRFRAAAGLDPAPPISVIANRQFRFLMRAAKSWEMAERFDQVERISSVMAGYITHGESGRAILPTWLSAPAPSPDSYIDKAIQYWLRQNRERVTANRQHTWQVGLGA